MGIGVLLFTLLYNILRPVYQPVLAETVSHMSVYSAPATPCGDTVQPGQLWQMRTKDPWGGKAFGPHRVLDIKDGWVRWQQEGTQEDNRLEAKIFMMSRTCISRQ
jgi:hypothetical protein